MSDIHKAVMTVEGKNVHMSMPIAKVNVEKRTVSGFATLDNVDSQDDVVLAEASARAFARARGNIREMHQPIAVGKVVDFREDEFFDEESGKLYRGVYVTARVSKGAESTWEKVLDGTLTGFSIGGEIIDSSTEMFKDASGKSKNIRIIKDYDLVELSLVDNPANQLANVFSIQKAANGSVTVTPGEVVDAEIENVFFCKEDTLIQSKTAESAECPQCGSKMEIAGWFENTGDRAEKVREVVAKYLAVEDSEGGAEMAKKDDEKVNEDETVETGHERGDETEVPTPAKTDSDAVEKSESVDETSGTETEVPAADLEEVKDETTEISKMIDDLKEVVTSSLDKVSGETQKNLESLEKRITDIDSAVKTQISELDRKLSGYDEKLNATKGRLAALETSLEKFNSAEAFRKSSDLQGPEKPVQKDKSAWNGAFSLDNLLS